MQLAFTANLGESHMACARLLSLVVTLTVLASVVPAAVPITPPKPAPVRPPVVVGETLSPAAKVAPLKIRLQPDVIKLPDSIVKLGADALVPQQALPETDDPVAFVMANGSPYQNVYASSRGYLRMALADRNGDGKLDLLVDIARGYSHASYTGNGRGGFQSSGMKLEYEYSTLSAYNLFWLADFTGDRYPDPTFLTFSVCFLPNLSPPIFFCFLLHSA
jgi:hypothetical protein